jgi:hypothetical protein
VTFRPPSLHAQDNFVHWQTFSAWSCCCPGAIIICPGNWWDAGRLGPPCHLCARRGGHLLTSSSPGELTMLCGCPPSGAVNPRACCRGHDVAAPCGGAAPLTNSHSQLFASCMRHPNPHTSLLSHASDSFLFLAVGYYRCRAPAAASTSERAMRMSASPWARRCSWPESGATAVRSGLWCLCRK